METRYSVEFPIRYSVLRPIPSVKTYACGGHYEFGRPTIKSDYTFGLLVSFDSAEGYRAYLEDPQSVSDVSRAQIRAYEQLLAPAALRTRAGAPRPSLRPSDGESSVHP